MNKALIERCKKVFGTTENPYFAGFIFPDGSMLDFQRDYGEDPALLHAHIGNCIDWKNVPDHVDESNYIPWFMEETGALRTSLGPDYAGWSGISKIMPTAAQGRRVGPVCRDAETCVWDVHYPDNGVCKMGYRSWSGFVAAMKRCRVK